MNSSALNDEGCFLLSNGSISQGLECLKHALSALRQEIQEGRQTPSSPCLNSGKMLGLPMADFLPTTISGSQTRQERFMIYSRPLLMNESIVRSSASDAFTISFNVALAAHMQAIQDSLAGDEDAARLSFVVALKMYNLMLQQSDQGTNCVPLNSRNDLIFAAAFNNLAHVYAALDQHEYSQVAAEQLLRSLFFLSDSGRLTSTEELQAHSSFMKNACVLTMNTGNTAAAA